MPGKPVKCPVCYGTGLVSKPSYIAGDQHSWTTASSGPYVCKCCNGTGILYVDENPARYTI